MMGDAGYGCDYLGYLQYVVADGGEYTATMQRARHALSSLTMIEENVASLDGRRARRLLGGSGPLLASWDAVAARGDI